MTRKLGILVIVYILLLAGFITNEVRLYQSGITEWRF